MLDFVQDNTQLSIFGIWDYLMARKDTMLPSRLQEMFNGLVNHHFDKDLQPLQLNKDRQNKVARAMLDNMRKADGYVDELNASIRQYQVYTTKLGSLVKQSASEENASSSSDASQASAEPGASEAPTSAQPEVPASIHVIYEKVKGYVTLLEDSNDDKSDELERLRIELYEAHSEIEHLEDNAKKLRMEIKAKQQQIKNLQEDREALGKELNQTKQELDDIRSQKEQYNKKLDDMMNVMLKGMSELKQDVAVQLKREINQVAEAVDSKVGAMEERMTARIDQVQDAITDVHENQEELKEDMVRVEQRMTDMQKTKKEKNMNLKISIHGADARDGEFKTRSDKLRSVQGK